MAAEIDITGEKFGSLVALRKINAGRWIFKCDCGVEKEATKKLVKSGKITSCGCSKRTAAFRASVSAHTSTKGGRSKHPIYQVWLGLFKRCNNPSSKSYARYGGRGITICSRWYSFENFVEDMGTRPSGMWIKRINNDGNYEPSNCCWATRKEQIDNRSCSRFLEYGGERMTVSDWARRLEVSKYLLFDRLKEGWSDHDVIARPKGKHTKKAEAKI